MLIVVAFFAGVIAGISPCILPVLPVVFFTGAVGADRAEANPSDDSAPAQRFRRPLSIALGLAISFTAAAAR